MKIALISAFLFDNSVGGLENHILFMSREFLALGHELKIFKPVWDDEFEVQEARLEGIDIHYVNLGKRPYNSLSKSGRGLGLLAGFLGKVSYSLKAKALVQAVSDWKPELVWQHDFSSSWEACRRLKKNFPVALTNHTGEYLFLRKLPLSEAILKRLLRHYAVVIGPSKELTPFFLKQSHTVHNGVNTDLFIPLQEIERQELRQGLYPDARACIVFCPRRWAPTKGIIYLAKAMQLLGYENRMSDFYFVFAGSDYWGFPTYIEEVDHILDDTQVRFEKLGNLSVEQMLVYYQTADVVIIPSLMEAVSLSALEAMASGAVVVSSDVGGMPELIEDQVNGFLVPPADFKALANVLKESCRGDLSEVRSKALELVNKDYAWRKIAKKTEAILEGVLSKNESSL